MDEVCATNYPGSSAAYATHILGLTEVAFLPDSNDSGFAVLPKCASKDCQGKKRSISLYTFLSLKRRV
jgi:hypothetical protein